MILTEEEAKEKICPKFLTSIMADFAEIYVLKQGNKKEMGKATKEYGKATTCNASNCMAWRWEDRVTNTEGVAVKSLVHGYCGLGGKP